MISPNIETVLGCDSSYRAASIVLYGNKSCHGAWHELALDSGEPVAPASSAWQGGAAPENRAWLVTKYGKGQEGPGGHQRGAIGGNTLRAMRATDRLSYFSAGVDYPAVTEFSPEVWAKGEEGVLVAGFPEADGTVDPEKLAWRAKK